MWVHLKEKFGETTMSKLRQLMIKFDICKKHPNHKISEHLNEISKMIRELKTTCHVLINKQQVQIMIHSLPNNWKHMKLNLTHINHIKTFTDVAQHVELKEKCLVFEKGTKRIFLVGSGSKRASSSKNKGKGQMWKGKNKKAKEIAHGCKKNFKENKIANNLNKRTNQR